MDQGKIVVVTTQVQNEGSDLAVYNVGHRLKRDLGVLESYDMTIEAAVAKLMWALAQTRDSRAVAALFYTPLWHRTSSAGQNSNVPGQKDRGHFLCLCWGLWRRGGTPAAPGKIGRRRGLAPWGRGSRRW